MSPTVEPRTVQPSRFRWWVEFPALIVLYECFEALRDHATGKAGPAQQHARWLIDIERWTWTLHEHPVNVFVNHHKTLAQAMDIYYGTIHFLIPPLVLLWLWRFHPAQYRRWRNILAALTVASLLFFWQFPLAPPRLIGNAAPMTDHASCVQALATESVHTHFVDTDACFGGLGPLDRGKFKDKNPYAAMPSLHMAWSTWCACAVIAALGAAGRRRRWRWAALLYPCWTLSVVVGTANHWIGDAVGGWLFLAGAWFGVSRWMNGRESGKEDIELVPA